MKNNIAYLKSKGDNLSQYDVELLEKELRERFEAIRTQDNRAFECFLIKEILGED